MDIYETWTLFQSLDEKWTNKLEHIFGGTKKKFRGSKKLCCKHKKGIYQQTPTYIICILYI